MRNTRTSGACEALYLALNCRLPKFKTRPTASCLVINITFLNLKNFGNFELEYYTRKIAAMI